MNYKSSQQIQNRHSLIHRTHHLLLHLYPDTGSNERRMEHGFTCGPARKGIRSSDACASLHDGVWSSRSSEFGCLQCVVPDRAAFEEGRDDGQANIFQGARLHPRRLKVRRMSEVGHMNSFQLIRVGVYNL